MAETRRIFGLSIDEELVWATGETNGHNVTNVRINPAGCIDGDDAKKQIVDLLRSFDRKTLDSFDGFGISTIGVVDSHKSQLVNLTRKNWKREKSGCIIDFKKLLSQYISRPEVAADRLFVQNDATAAALAEYEVRKRPGQKIDRLFYLTINEGLNAGIIYHKRPLPMGAHPEVGHIRAALRADDPAMYGDGEFDLECHTGCVTHQRCFEGVASGRRIRQSWGGKDAPRTFTLTDLPIDHIAWQLSAFYIAQLCMIGALMISPERIVIGGHVMNKSLLPLVRAKFDSLNGGYFLPTYMRDKDLIQQSHYGAHVNVRGALELAQLAAYQRQNRVVGLI